MPRTSRSVAQRLAAQQAKSKKRRSPRPVAPAPADAQATTPAGAPASSPSGPSVAQILDEVMPSEGGSRAAATPVLAPAASRAPSSTAARTGAVAQRSLGRGVGKLPPTRRRYSEYAVEYAYVWADLRRICIVAGVLIALLVALSFVLQ